MRIIFLVLFFFVALTEANSQITSREYLQLAEETRAYGEDELIDYVSKKKYTPFDIAKFFYYWISTNISYDHDLANLPDGDPRIRQGVIPDNVLSTRKTICEGYSQLYKYFLEEFDIEVEVIHGVGRTLENSHLIKEYLPNHAWNAVLLNGKWKQVDVTWASSLKNFIDHYGYYFDTKPEVFILNHYPHFDEWQLLNEPFSFEEFKNLPVISPLYFILGFESYVPKEATTVYGQDSVRINIGVSEEWYPKLVAIDENGKVESVQFKRRESEKYQEIVFSRKGLNGILRLDSYSVQNEGSYLLTHDGLAYFNLD